MSKETPTTRTMKVLEAARLGHTSKLDPNLAGWLGTVYLIEKVEWFDARARRSHDFAGVFDVLYFDDFGGGNCKSNVIGVQITSGSNAAARRTKIDDSPRIHELEAAQVRMEVWSWRKLVSGMHLRIDERWIGIDGPEWGVAYNGPAWR